MPQIVAISGSGGFVGQRLSRFFSEQGFQIRPIKTRDFENQSVIDETIADADIVVNLAGAPIIARWSEEYKKVLRSSRIETTQKIIQAIQKAKEKPSLFISTSAVGIYDNQGIHTEEDHRFNDDLLSLICQEWESCALKAKEMGVRTVIFRFGVVLGKEGGMMQKVLPPFSWGLGGPIGSGKQAFSWIHIDDLEKVYAHVVKHPEMEGIYNLGSPHPVSNAEFTKALGKALSRPAFFPLPEFVLRWMYGDGSKVMTDGQSMIPQRLIEEGFEFSYPRIEEALREIVA